MKKACKLVIIIAFLAVTSLLIAAPDWNSQGSISTEKTGLVETVLPAALHQTLGDRSRRNTLDLALIGPDGNQRAFELFWRSAGEYRTIEIQPKKSELLEDRRLVLESALPPGQLFNFVTAEIDYDNYAGKVDVECQLDGIWQILATGVAVQRYQGVACIRADIPEAAYTAIRLTFSGYSMDFSKMPVFIRSVSVAAKQSGSDYAQTELVADFDETLVERGVELRVVLPGSGLTLEGLEIKTAAPFKGRWQIGYEKILLGRRDFQVVAQGQVDAIGGKPLKLDIAHSGIWENRVMLINLTSDEFFGKVEQFKVRVRLPRVVFAADQPGVWNFCTGLNKPATILERPGVADRNPELYLEIADLNEKAEWQAKNLLGTYNLKGGPFSVDGYTWKSAFNVGTPGFYQLVTNDRICLDRNRESFRIVRDEVQVPYFRGRAELRDLEVSVEHSYDAAANSSVYVVKLPKGSARLAGLKFYARGIFERDLSFERHVVGQVSWQPWQKRRWSNKNDGESAVTMSLQDFPEDQFEIRMSVDHASNQPLEIYGFRGLYSAQDLFFIAIEPGNYELIGGNPAVRAPVYDLTIIQDKLLDMTPQKIQAGAVEVFADASAASAKPVDQGAPFNNAGYNWVAPFKAETSGFYQLDLNLQAALDDNRAGLRLVKNGGQVPYFAGSREKASVDVSHASEYTKTNNTTICTVTLPAASKGWKSLKFVSSGVFSREPVLEISKPGRLGWQTFKKASWTSRTESQSTLEISLDRLPEGETQLRLVVAHGDNSPIEITSAQATYYTQSLFFHAAETGEYQLYGGNIKARAPVYDLALIKDHMLKNEPIRIKLGNVAEYDGGVDIKRQFDAAFSETGWGLYAVLGVVTLLLIVIIVKLFPEDEKSAQASAKAAAEKSASDQAEPTAAETSEKTDTAPDAPPADNSDKPSDS
ncbi:MAG: hypothetical protein KKB51_23630 [Candidatus Riflebacteria bacterium]|nr:hypothetical protein [Candidatus Riflebacteria bacterium]